MEDASAISNILIYGAGTSGLLAYEAIKNDKTNHLEIIGFIDDDDRKIGKRIDQLKVYDINEITKETILKLKIEQVVISIQNIESYRLLQITSKLFELKLKVKIVPPVKIG